MSGMNTGAGRSREMKLFAWVSSSAAHYHSGTWRHPGTELPIEDFESLVRLTQTLEAAKFDAVFFADGMSGLRAQNERTGPGSLVDPIPLAAMLAHATSRIGIGITANVQYLPTHMLARLLGSVDLLSGGRLAWNVVTGYTERAPRLFGRAGVVDRHARYRLAAEVVEACTALWRSFPREAIVVDRASGQYHDSTRLTEFDFTGEFVRTAGPLDVPASPQGGPVIMQAGTSPEGRDFAAKHAEVVFAMLSSISEITAFVDDMRERQHRVNRILPPCLIIPLVTVVAAATEAQARSLWHELESLIDTAGSLAVASHVMGVDLTNIDATLSASSVLGADEMRSSATGSAGLRELALRIAQEQDLTLSEAAAKMATSGVPEVIGSYEQVADRLCEIFSITGVDGFMIHAPTMPAAFENFATGVVPLLQQRGIYRRDYTAQTLRGHLLGTDVE